MPFTPPAVPTVPLTERVVGYDLTAAATAVVPFTIWGDVSDLFVSLNGVEYTTATLVSPSGLAAPTPITDGVLHFSPVITGHLVIEGRRAPRRTSNTVEGSDTARVRNIDTNTIVSTQVELKRRVGRAMSLTPSELVDTGSFDARGLGISDVATGVLDGDAANVGQLAAAIAAGIATTGPDRIAAQAAAAAAAASQGVATAQAVISTAAANSAAAAEALAQQYASDAATVSGVNVPIYAAKATAAGATIVAGVKSIATQFFNPTYITPSTLVGGGNYSRMSLAVITAAAYPALSYFRSTDRFMPDGTTDATNGGYWVLNVPQPTPQMFGVVNYTGSDASAPDQTTALQAWLHHCEAAGVAPYVAVPTQAKHTTMLEYDPTASGVIPHYINMRHLRLRTSGVGVGGMKIGSPLRTLYHADIHTPSVVNAATTVSWSGTDGALGEHGGLILYNFLFCTVFLSDIYYFTFGVAYHAENTQFAYNNIYGGNMTDCKYNEVLRCISLDTAFCNENNFFGGTRRTSSASNLLGDAYGTYFGSAAGAYTSQNNNHWYGTTYEMGAPASATYRAAVFLDGAGGSNLWHKPRFEGGKGPFGIAKGISSNLFAGCYNEVDMGYLAGASVSLYPWLQVNGALSNIAVGGSALESLWHSGPLVNALSSGGVVAAARIKPPFFWMQSAGGTPLRATSLVQATTNTKALQTACAVMVEIDTSIIKDFEIAAQALSGFSGRVIAQALDANGAILSGTITDSWGTEQYIKLGGVAQTTFGGTYQFSSDTPAPVRITVRDEVKRMRVGYCGGTNVLALESFSLRSRTLLTPSASSLSRGMGVTLPTGLDVSDQLLATQNPATAGVYGKYSRGDTVLSTAAASAAAEGWQCTLSGWLAAAWAISTAYTVPGHVVINDTGKAYEVLTPGTSAGSGGPTGTGGATAWAITTAYSVGNYASQSGNTYKCTTAGTSAGSGGPASVVSTARQASITDGTVVWTFYDGTVPITDNTCTWRYIGVQATFAVLPNLP